MKRNRAGRRNGPLISWGGLIAGLLVAVLSAPGGVGAQGEEKKQPAQPQELTCKKLTIVDGDGKARVVLDFNDKGGVFRVLNKEQKNIAMIDNDVTGGVFRLFGNNEKRMLIVGGNKDGCQINACDPNGNIRAYLGCDSSHEGYFSLRNKDNKTIAYGGADDDGGLVRIYGHDGKERVFVGVGNKKGDGLLMTYGTDNKRRFWIGSDEEACAITMYSTGGVLQHELRGGKGGAFHSMFTKDGKSLIATVGAANDSGEGILRLNSTQGKTQAYIGSNKNGSGGLILLNTPNDSSRVVIGIDANGVGFGEGRDADNVVRRSFK